MPRADGTAHEARPTASDGEAGSSDAADRGAVLRRRILDRGEAAFTAYAADKVTKVRELRARMERGCEPPESDAPVASLEHYVLCLGLLEHERPGHPVVRELRTELEKAWTAPPFDDGPQEGRMHQRSTAGCVPHTPRDAPRRARLLDRGSRPPRPRGT